MEEKLLKQRKEKILELTTSAAYSPLKIKEIAIFLNIPKSKRRELEEVLDGLIADGKLALTKKGKYRSTLEKLPAEKIKEQEPRETLTGTYAAHPRGFGFVAVEGRETDLFIAPDHTAGAMDGDTVQITVEEARGDRRAEGTVVKVLEHANETVIGVYEKNRSFGFVVSDNPKILADIFIPQGKDMGAVSGHKVVVKLTSFGDKKKNPEGEVVEILGHINDPGVDILSIIRSYGLPEEFPEEVMEEVGEVPESLAKATVTRAVKAGRLDLRNVPMVTIDGEDAKDLDDAVSLSKETVNGRTLYHLGVHIADVSNYVKENHALDQEALKRGTSVYLVDRVIPMLPHRLSNGICSLNAGCDRFALSCLMEIDESGTVMGHQIAETAVNIDRRMTYTAVAAILAPPETPTPEKLAFRETCLKEYRAFVPMFLLMKELSDILRESRKRRGSVDFDFPECEITLNAAGKPVEIKPHERSAATDLIEDFMLAANETVAEEFNKKEIPFLYRTHEKPDEDRIERFTTLIHNFGYSVRLENGELRPKEMQKLLEKVSGKPEEALISRMALRSMQQAKYTTECFGHFGLAAEYYSHFTSPIRRYPDLQIHRIIKESLHGKLTDRRTGHYKKILPEVAAQSSSTERQAEEAERETDKIKKVEFMMDHIGEKFEGVISGVTGYGFYVELPSTIEGMVRVSELNDDYYLFEEDRCQLVGERTRKIYKLGEKIKVQVVSADKYMKTIDFLPVRKL